MLKALTCEALTCEVLTCEALTCESQCFSLPHLIFTVLQLYTTQYTARDGWTDPLSSWFYHIKQKENIALVQQCISK